MVEAPSLAEFDRMLAAFSVGARAVAAERIPGGHIHGTWAVTVAPEDRARGAAAVRRYVAQSLNTNVFTDLSSCEDNLRRIDDHLNRRSHRPSVSVPRLARTNGGSVQWCDRHGVTWRLAEYAEGTEAMLSAGDVNDAHQAALAFGRYVRELADLPGAPLAPTVARFHDLAWRLQQLRDAADANPCGRLGACADDVERLSRTAASIVSLVGDLSSLPRRTVHNDAKVANVRFDIATGKAVCVVDLDTTMPGAIAFDVGELLRTATVAVAEDAHGGGNGKTSAVVVEPDGGRVEAVVRGFVEGVGDALDAAERASLVYAGPMMAIENGVRFLADHLLGDGYYGATRPGQNLDRARTQLAIAEALRDRCADVVVSATRA